MRKIIFGLKHIIMTLVIAQAIIALGVVVVWFDSRDRVLETQNMINNRTTTGDAQNDEMMRLIRSQLYIMNLIKKRQDEHNDMLQGLLDKAEPTAQPTPEKPAFKPPFRGRPN